MISTNDFHIGLSIDIDGEIYAVIEFQHVKPGKGAAFVRSKLRNLRTGATTEKTFRAGEKVSRAHLERKEMQFLYRDGDDYYVMDTETYEQISINVEQIGEKTMYIKENDNIFLVLYGEEIIEVEVANTVELKVVKTDPGVRGDTASGGSKPATLETGLVVQVPFFINEGDVLKIDTRSGNYLERA